MDGARIFVLNSPGNPTGAVESKESIKAIVEYADDAGVTVVSDEVYEHFIYGKKHWSAARFGENVITINATSKTYAMTGWRLGYLAASRRSCRPVPEGAPVLPGLCHLHLPVCRCCCVRGRPGSGCSDAGRIPGTARSYL